MNSLNNNAFSGPTTERFEATKATQSEAVAGSDNKKYMTPLRTFQAVAAWVAQNLSWATLAGKPSTFPPAAHTHTAAEVGAVTAFQIQGNPPETNIAPSAMELRDNEDQGNVALKCDGTTDDRWSVLFPDSFRAAIGAATSAQGAKADGTETLLNNLRDPSKELADWTVQRAFALWDDSYESRALQFTGYDVNASVLMRYDYHAPFVAHLNLATTTDVLGVHDKVDNETYYRGLAISNLQTALDGKQAAGSYATLVGGLVPSAQLPSYVDDVLEYATLAAFPATGETGKIYVASGTNKVYRWSGSAYVEIVAAPGSTDAVPEGSVNLYFTAARAVSALASTLASYATTSALNSAISGLSTVYTTTAAVASQITAYGYQTASQVSSAISTALASYATTSSVNSAISALVTGVSSVAGRAGAVTLAKSDVGLGNVDNTSDTAKPISTATQTALNAKAATSHTHALSDLTQSGASANQVPTWNGTAWVPATPVVTNFQPSPEYNADNLAHAQASGFDGQPTAIFSRVNADYYQGNNIEYYISRDGQSHGGVAGSWNLYYQPSDAAGGMVALSTTATTYPWQAAWTNGVTVVKAALPRIVGAPLAVSASEGTSAYAARADHVHPFPSALQVGAAPIQGGKIPAQYLPSYVDDVVEYETLSALQADTSARVSGKIYVVLDTGKIYRWSSGTLFIEISSTLELDDLQLSDAFASVYANVPGFTTRPLPLTGTLNGKPRYTGNFGGDNYDVYWTGTNWQAQAEYDDDGYAYGESIATGNTAYPWQATGWTNNGGVTRIGTYNAALAPAPLAADGSSGIGTKAAREDHVHPFPTAAQIGAAAASHTHAISDTTGLQTALDGKAATSHTHTLSQLTQSGATNTQVPTWNGTAWVPSTPVVTNFQPNPDHPSDAVANAEFNGEVAIRQNHPLGGGRLPIYNLGGGGAGGFLNQGSGGRALIFNAVEYVNDQGTQNVWACILHNGDNAYSVVDSAYYAGGNYPWSVVWENSEVYKQASARLVGAPLAATAAEGTSAYAARADHVHPLPTPAQIGAATAAQGAKADSALQSGAAISNISGLQTALDGKQVAGSYAPATGISPSAITGLASVATTGAYADLSGTPTAFNPAAPGAIGGTTAAPGSFTTLLTSGNGAASAPPARLTGTWFSGGTATTTKPQFLIEPAGTTSTSWSTAGTGLGVNAASGFAGNLADFQVNGTYQARILSTGALRWNTTNNPEWFPIAGGILWRLFNGGAAMFGFYNNFLLLNVSMELSWNSIGDAGNPAGRDLTLLRDAADTLAQRRGTNPQTFRLYNTYTDASNYERGVMRWSGNALQIGTEKLGTGTARGLELRTDNVARISLSATGGIGFYGAVASAQPTAVADATDAASVITQINALLSRLRTIGIIAT